MPSTSAGELDGADDDGDDEEQEGDAAPDDGDVFDRIRYFAFLVSSDTCDADRFVGVDVAEHVPEELAGAANDVSVQVIVAADDVAVDIGVATEDVAVELAFLKNAVMQTDPCRRSAATTFRPPR